MFLRTGEQKKNYYPTAIGYNFIGTHGWKNKLLS